MIPRRWLFGLLGALAMLPGRPIPAAEAKEVIICPAVRQDDRCRHPNDFFEDTRQPELIVLGSSENRGEIIVEKVLYGSCKGKKLEYSAHYAFEDKSGRGVFALVPRRFERQAAYQLRYSVDAADEKGMRALALARLDYNALHADCIFLGKETAVLDDRRRTVEVVRPLAGDAPEKGRNVTVSLSEYLNDRGGKPLLRTETLIYFVAGIDTEKGEGRPQTVYYVPTRQPADQEEAVRAARARRKEYPVVETEGETAYREVMFRGTTAEAIDLLGCERDAVVTLGARKLLHEPRTARPAVTVEVEKLLPRLEEKRHGDFRRLKNLLAVLGHMKKEPAARDDLRRLLDGHIAFVAEQSRKLPEEKPAPPKRSPRDEEEREDVHHGLAWLVQQLDEDEVSTRYGRRLLQLRKQARGRWRQEVQLALDVGKVEDHDELAAAFARMKNVKPLRSDKVHKHRLVDVYFAADGKTLRSLDDKNHLCIWDAATLRLLRRLDLPVTLHIESARPPDGKYLLCFESTEKGDKETLRVVDADSGKTVASIELPRDGGTYLWMSAYVVRRATEKKVIYFDCRTGKTVKEPPPVQEFPPSTEVARSADGLSLYGVDHDPERGYVSSQSWPLSGGESKHLGSTKLPSGVVNRSGLVPGGKYAYGGDPDLYLLEWPTLKVVAERRFRGADLLDLQFTRRGDRYAVVTGGRIFVDEYLRSWDPKTMSIVRVHETLSGKTLAAFPTSTRWVRVRFGPGGDRLAVVNEDNTIELWDLSGAK